jgi:hypothetical protein
MTYKKPDGDEECTQSQRNEATTLFKHQAHCELLLNQVSREKKKSVK